MHIPMLPRRHWPSNRGKKLLASPTTPLESASCGDPFRRLVRSLSLRPSQLLALSVLTRPRCFNAHLGRLGLLRPGFQLFGSPRRLPDMTTVPHGDLHRRDFHPQVQQLASLRSLPRVLDGASSPASSVLSGRYDFLPLLSPCFVAFAWRYHSSARVSPALRPSAAVGGSPGVGHPVSPTGYSVSGDDRISYVPGEPQLCSCPALRPR